jgi:hypothetical protein
MSNLSERTKNTDSSSLNPLLFAQQQSATSWFFCRVRLMLLLMTWSTDAEYILGLNHSDKTSNLYFDCELYDLGLPILNYMPLIHLPSFSLLSFFLSFFSLYCMAFSFCTSGANDGVLRILRENEKRTHL